MVDFLAEFARLVAVVVVVVIIVVVVVLLILARNASRNHNGFFGKRKGRTRVHVSIDICIGPAGALIIVKDTEVNGFAILGGAVGSNVVVVVRILTVVTVVVSILVPQLYKSGEERG